MPRTACPLSSSARLIFYLLLTTLLTGCLWIPVIIGQVKARGFLQAQDYVTAPTSPLPDWVNRANRAHLNAVENFAPFAALVLTAQVMGMTNDTTATCAAVFFFARLAHAVIHISGFKYFMARTVASIVEFKQQGFAF